MKLPNLPRTGALLAIGMTFTAAAYAQYPAYQGQAPQGQAPYYNPTHTPPSWSYDPYTSGLGPCTQKDHKDLAPCSDLMPPTYGQPSYWSR